MCYCRQDWIGSPFMFSLPFSTVLLRRYLGWTAGEEWLLSRLWTVEVIQMTSRSLWTAVLGTYNLVSFRFLCCFILFEYDSKCERVSAFSIMIFCADSVQWGSKTGDDQCRSCQQGFCCLRICCHTVTCGRTSQSTLQLSYINFLNFFWVFLFSLTLTYIFSFLLSFLFIGTFVYL